MVEVWIVPREKKKWRSKL